MANSLLPHMLTAVPQTWPPIPRLASIVTIDAFHVTSNGRRQPASCTSFTYEMKLCRTRAECTGIARQLAVRLMDLRTAKKASVTIPE
jgi:hypothetical protein